MNSSRDFPFRRNTSIDPVFVPATDTPSKMTVPDLRNVQGITAFGVDNTFPCHIRLVGTGFGSAQFNAANEGKGWIFGPGKHGPFSTQFPEFMSAVAVDRPGFPIKDANGALLYPNAGLEIFYGSGTGGWGGAASPFVFVRNFPATQPVSGVVSANVTFPATQAVTQSGPWAVNQAGAWNVSATQSGNWAISGTVAVSNFPATQAVSGSVGINNFPATQTVSGTVGVNNFPATTVTIDRGSPSIATGQVAVTQGAVVSIAPARTNRRKITLSPSSNIPYLVGTTGMTASTGFAVLSGGAITLDTTAAISVIAGNNGTMTFVETFG